MSLGDFADAFKDTITRTQGAVEFYPFLYQSSGNGASSRACSATPLSRIDVVWARPFPLEVNTSQRKRLSCFPQVPATPLCVRHHRRHQRPELR